MVTKVALGLLVVGGSMVVLAAAPGIGAALKLVDPNPRKAVQKLQRTLSRLVKDGDIETVGSGQKRKFRLTATGKQKFARLQFTEFLPSNPRKWDGKWRLVCFDIPETEKYARTVFQTKLSSLGFYRLQNSVFVSPHPCTELVTLAHKAFDFAPHVRLVTAEHIDNEDHLKNFFHLN